MMFPELLCAKKTAPELFVRKMLPYMLTDVKN